MLNSQKRNKTTVLSSFMISCTTENAPTSGHYLGLKKKIVCFRSPDRPYFEAPTLNFFLVVKIRFSQVNIFQFSDDYFGSPKRFTDRP